MADINKQDGSMFRVKKVAIILLLSTFLSTCDGQAESDLSKVLDEQSNKCKDSLPGCYCTDRAFVCDGGKFLNLFDIKEYLTSDTYYLSVVNGDLQIVEDGLFDFDNKITHLNLSGNTLTSVNQGAFKGLENLELLDLSDNKHLLSAETVSSILAPLSGLRELYMKSSVTASAKLGDLFVVSRNVTQLPKLQKLDLSINAFNETDSAWNEFLCNAYELSYLNISNNDFEDLPVPACMSGSLEVLDVSNNNIKFLTKVEADIIVDMLNLKKLRLSGNKWDCSCDMYFDMPTWLNQSELPLDAEDVKCITSEKQSLVGKPIIDLTLDEICEPRIIVCYGPNGPISVAKATFYWVSGVVVLLVVAVVLTVFICYRRRRKLKMKNHNVKESRIIPNNPKSPSYERIV